MTSFADQETASNGAQSKVIRAGYATPIPNSHSNRANVLFANNVRFISMVCIVAIHTTSEIPWLTHAESLKLPLNYLTMPLRFASIGFFLVSGFLFGNSIERCSPGQYYKRRMRRIFIPWLVWLAIFGLLNMAPDIIHRRLAGVSLEQELTIWKGYMFTTSFWYVPNLLFALGILVLFRKRLADLRFGFFLMLVSLFYGVNIYGNWIDVSHMHALFGYVFYLWVGAWSALHFTTIEKWIDRVPGALIAGFVFFMLLAAFAEMHLLVVLRSVDPSNSLRITNQIYAVGIVIAIIKLRKPTWPRFIDVRAHTFGIYLSHTSVLVFLNACIKHLPLHMPVGYAPGGVFALLFAPILFGSTYTGSLIVVRRLHVHRSLRWMVGMPLKETASAH